MPTVNPPSTAFASSLTTEALIQALMGGTAKRNEEDIHDSEKDIDSNNWNQIVYALAEVVKRLRHGNLVCLAYETTNIAGTATATCTIVGSANAETAHRVFKDATLVAISAKLNTNKTAGTLTVQPQIDGVNTALSMTIADASDGNRVYQVVADADAADVADASDLDDITLDITTASFTPTTADGTFWLWFDVGGAEDI